MFTNQTNNPTLFNHSDSVYHMDPLVGKEIAEVRECTDEEMELLGWRNTRHRNTQVIVLDDGSKLYSAMDEELNGPGVLLQYDANEEQLYQITG